MFEQICQAVGYAHAHNVIHRDLKPANIMVGAFGEVQVMDWGLAKSLTDEPAVGTIAATAAPTFTVIEPLHDPNSATQAGSVFGTLAFMPPEQAGGEIAKIDARSDVFSLGAVLCVILTGEPPYPGDSGKSVHLKAVRGQLAGALARLDASGTEPELVALCKQCLSVDPADRLQDANDLAAAVARFRANSEERARQAELDRVRAEAEVRQQRKRRKSQLERAASVALLLASGGGFAWYTDHQASERKLNAEHTARERENLEEDRNTKAEQARQSVAANVQLAGDLRRQYKFKQAHTALAQSKELAEGCAQEVLVKKAQADLALVVKLDDVRFRKWVWIAEEGNKGDFNTKIASQEYREAFVEGGLELQALAPTEAA